MKKIYLSLLFVLFASAAQGGASDLHEGIVPTIEVVQSEYGASDSLKIRVTYTNVTPDDVRILKWGTALEGDVPNDFLAVSLDGEEIPYIGTHVKRLPPQESDFVVIGPGQSLTEVVDLAKSYDIRLKGDYQLRYRGSHSDGSESLAKSTSSTLLKVVEERAATRITSAKRTPIIDSSCSATQRNQINEALTIAERIALSAIADLNNAPLEQRSSARRYTEWFGAYSATNYETVRQGMARITDALVNRQIGFDCTCDDSRRENLFAFVFTNDPFNMNVCPVFFRVAAAGTDSRSGTIVHEISHFNVVATTLDFSSALNQSGSRSLAQNNPNSAIRNANAYEYFAENTPFLSMPVASTEPDPETDPDPDPDTETEPQPELESKIPSVAPLLPLLLDE